MLTYFYDNFNISNIKNQKIIPLIFEKNTLIPKKSNNIERNINYCYNEFKEDE